MITELPITDYHGKEVKVDDKIMYITTRSSSTYVNYGTVSEIKETNPAWHRGSVKIYNLVVLKTGGPWFDKPVKVTLKNPLMFKMGVALVK